MPEHIFNQFVVDGEVPSYFVRKATEEWKRLRVEVGSSSAFVLQERLFFLTLFLTPSLLMIQANVLRRWRERRALPPPPAAALMSNGKPICPASVSMRSTAPRGGRRR